MKKQSNLIYIIWKMFLTVICWGASYITFLLIGVAALRYLDSLDPMGDVAMTIFFIFNGITSVITSGVISKKCFWDEN